MIANLSSGIKSAKTSKNGFLPSKSIGEGSITTSPHHVLLPIWQLPRIAQLICESWPFIKFQNKFRIQYLHTSAVNTVYKIEMKA